MFNPLFGVLLRSPAYRLVDRPFMILHLTGRRTGMPHDVVVGRHQLASICTVCARRRRSTGPARPIAYDLADGRRAVAQLETRATISKLALLP